MDQTTKGLQDYIAIFRRRTWEAVIPFAALLLVTMVVALILPPVYRSSATILIEEPDVPRELVTSTITSFADQRLQIINQRVMATQNLLDIVRKYDLYADKRRDLPLSEVIEDMREDIGMQLVSAEVRDPKSGGPTKATIAFKVSFDHGRPETAQRVANEVVSLYLSENLRERQEKATETAAFLEGEAARWRTRSPTSVASLRISSRNSPAACRNSSNTPCKPLPGPSRSCATWTDKTSPSMSARFSCRRNCLGLTPTVPMWSRVSRC